MSTPRDTRGGVAADVGLALAELGKAGQRARLQVRDDVRDALVRARVDKWTVMNDQILPMAVAMREGSWVWGGRVARELARRRREVDELSVRVDVVDGLRQMQRKNARGGGKEEAVGVPDGCTII